MPDDMEHTSIAVRGNKMETLEAIMIFKVNRSTLQSLCQAIEVVSRVQTVSVKQTDKEFQEQNSMNLLTSSNRLPIF